MAGVGILAVATAFGGGGVRYRGIFINDEHPSTYQPTCENLGG